MAFIIQWDDAEQTIIHITYDADWTWDDYQASMQAAGQMVRSVNHTADIIFEYQERAVIPLGSPLENFKRSLGSLPDYTGIRVIVGGNAFVQEMATIFSQRFARHMSHKLVFVHTLEEAYQAIHQRRKYQRQ